MTTATIEHIKDTTATNESTRTTSTDQIKKVVISICCLAFFPLVYLIGSTIMNFLG
jgi:hypothetical protein